MKLARCLINIIMLISLRLAVVALVTTPLLAQIMAVAGEDEHNLVYQVVVAPKEFKVASALTGLVLHAHRRLRELLHPLRLLRAAHRHERAERAGRQRQVQRRPASPR